MNASGAYDNSKNTGEHRVGFHKSYEFFHCLILSAIVYISQYYTNTGIQIRRMIKIHIKRKPTIIFLQTFFHRLIQVDTLNISSKFTTLFDDMLSFLNGFNNDLIVLFRMTTTLIINIYIDALPGGNFLLL